MNQDESKRGHRTTPPDCPPSWASHPGSLALDCPLTWTDPASLSRSLRPLVPEAGAAGVCRCRVLVPRKAAAVCSCTRLTAGKCPGRSDRRVGETEPWDLLHPGGLVGTRHKAGLEGCGILDNGSGEKDSRRGENGHKRGRWAMAGSVGALQVMWGQIKTSPECQSGNFSPRTSNVWHVLTLQIQFCLLTSNASLKKITYAPEGTESRLRQTSVHPCSLQRIHNGQKHGSNLSCPSMDEWINEM